MDRIPDTYLTIIGRNRDEIKVKGSKFIATVSYAPSKEAADTFLNEIRAEFYNATHNCYAYRIGENGLEYRSADDGEPSGSAGKPILFSIMKFDLSDVIVVVTRFFGGTKLGVGGLARAYSQAAELALEGCTTKVVHLTKSVKVFCTYEDISQVKRLVDEYAVSYKDEYTDSIEFTVELHRSDIDTFIKLITTNTAGRAGVIILNEEIDESN